MGTLLGLGFPENDYHRFLLYPNLSSKRARNLCGLYRMLFFNKEFILSMQVWLKGSKNILVETKLKKIKPVNNFQILIKAFSPL